jgi:hypothetical protein
MLGLIIECLANFNPPEKPFGTYLIAPSKAAFTGSSTALNCMAQKE